MTQVYVVEQGEDYEGSGVVGAFSTLEKARECVQRLPKAGEEMPHCYPGPYDPWEKKYDASSSYPEQWRSSWYWAEIKPFVIDAEPKREEAAE